MIYRIIVSLFILASIAMPILLVNGNTNSADKELEDEEQMRYLEEWRKMGKEK